MRQSCASSDAANDAATRSRICDNNRKDTHLGSTQAGAITAQDIVRIFEKHGYLDDLRAAVA